MRLKEDRGTHPYYSQKNLVDYKLENLQFCVSYSHINPSYTFKIENGKRCVKGRNQNWPQTKLWLKQYLFLDFYLCCHHIFFPLLTTKADMPPHHLRTVFKNLSQRLLKYGQLYLFTTLLPDKQPVSPQDAPRLGELWLHCPVDWNHCLGPTQRCVLVAF